VGVRVASNEGRVENCALLANLQGAWNASLWWRMARSANNREE
jgi:hypothetical protein